MKKYTASAILFLFFWGLLIKGVHPTVSFSDSGELITGAYTLGVAHSPGQPLYLLLTSLFSIIPLGEIAFRINFLSAFFGCIALVIFLLLIKMNTSTIISFGAVLAAFFFTPFLQQCIWSEVYTLTLVMQLTAIFLCLSYTDSSRFTPFLALTLGLGVVAHFSTLLLLPFFFIGVLFFTRFKLTFKQIIMTIFFFLMALATFSYLPLRAIKHPFLNWGSPYNLTGFAYHMLIKQRGGGLPGGGMYEQIGQLLELGKAVVSQFNWGSLLILFLLISYPLLKDQEKLSTRFFILLITGGAYLLPGWFLKFNSLELARLQGPKFFLLVYFLLTYVGFRTVYLLMKRFRLPIKFKQLTVFAIITILFILIHPNFFNSINKLTKNSNYFYAYDFSDNLLKNIDKTRTMFFADDTFGFPALYQHVVLAKLPNIRLVHLGNTFTNWGVENLINNYPELHLSYLKDKHPPYSVYQLGPKFIKELIKEKGPSMPILSPFKVNVLPPGYRNYTLNNGFIIAKKPPQNTSFRKHVARGFHPARFVKDRWTQLLAKRVVR